MQITPEMCEAMYEFIRTTPPYKGWKLPAAEDVEFHIIHSRKVGADYYCKSDGTHQIRVNARWCGNVVSLYKLLLHEMVHLHHGYACPNDNAHHGRKFLALARQVCKAHVLDPKVF